MSSYRLENENNGDSPFFDQLLVFSLACSADLAPPKRLRKGESGCEGRTAKPKKGSVNPRLTFCNKQQTVNYEPKTLCVLGVLCGQK
jgi:hypothetical protein